MPTFKLRSPDAFSSDFHRALERGFEELYRNGRDEYKTGILEPFELRITAERVQKKLQAFRMCLRRHPLHRLHHVLAAVNMRCEIVGSPGTYYIVAKFTKRNGAQVALAEALED